jgi:hypothetical protein
MQLGGQLYTVFTLREGQMVHLRDHARAPMLSPTPGSTTSGAKACPPPALPAN